MIDSRKKLFATLKYEQSLYGCKRINSFIPRFSEQGLIWKYVILYRKCEYYLNKKKKIRFLLYSYKFKKLGLKLGFSLPLNVIEKGLMIYHRGNLIINAKHIGENFSTAGTAFLVAKGQNGDSPTIEDNVSLGMNVTIIGGVKIASMIAIGAGSVVTKSFDNLNVTIAGNPAKVINASGGSELWGGWNKKFGKKNKIAHVHKN